MIRSNNFGLVLFHIFRITALNSSLHWSIFPIFVLQKIIQFCKNNSQNNQNLPSTLIFKFVRMSANKVALNMTVPSLFKGIFIDTNF